MLMAIADGKAIMYSSWMLCRTWWIVWQMLYHIVPPCAKDVMFSNYIMYAPWLPIQHKGYLPMIINLTPTTGLMPCQAQQYEPWFPLVGRSHRKVLGQGWLRRLFYIGPSMWSMSPLHPVYVQECLPMDINWTSTNGLKPCRVQPGPVHGPWPPSSVLKAQGNTRFCVIVLPKLEF